MQVDAVASGHRRRMSLTSLIDVIFLLLLFFMLTATFSRFGDVELTTGGGAAGTAEISRLVFVQLREDGVTLNGQTIALERLGAELAALNADGRTDAIILSVRADATAQQLVDVIGIVNTLGTMPLQIVR